MSFSQSKPTTIYLPKLFSDSNNSTPSVTTKTILLPPELRGLTLGYVGENIVAETPEEPAYPYTNSSRQFNFFNQTDLPVTVLLRHVVRGELKEVKAMLEQNPALVLYKGQVTDYSGRTIEGTAYQIALGAEDVSTGKDKKGNDKADGMAEMIRSYFMRAYHHDEKAAAEAIVKQFEAQFPKQEFSECYELDDKKREAIIKIKNANDPDLKALDAVINVILTADVKEIKRIPKNTKDGTSRDEYTLEVTGECAKALQVFKDYLKPRGVIKKGKHFNAQLLIKAVEKYSSDQFFTYGGKSAPKNLLFWRQIVGSIQLYLPACAAMAFCHGVHHINDDGESLKRDLKLVNGPDFFSSVPGSQLGVDHAVYSFWRIGGCAETGLEHAVHSGFSKLMSNKNSSQSKELMQSYSDDSYLTKNWCVIL